MAVPFALRVSTADSASRRPSLKMTDARSVAIRNLQTTIYRTVLDAGASFAYTDAGDLIARFIRLFLC